MRKKGNRKVSAKTPLSLALSFVLAFGMVPAVAFADDDTVNGGIDATVENPEELEADISFGDVESELADENEAEQTEGDASGEDDSAIQEPSSNENLGDAGAAENKGAVSVPLGMELVFNGETQCGVAGGEGYELSGIVEAVEVGTYEAIATLLPGYVWDDGTTESKVVVWSIKAKSIPVPTGSNLEYTGEPQQGIVAVEGYDISGDVEAVEPGEYIALVALLPGYVWDDGTIEPKEITWSIVDSELNTQGYSTEWGYSNIPGGIKISWYSGNDVDVVVPSRINGEPVLAISSTTFKGYSQLKSVTLPSTLVEIPFWSFKDCKSLVSVNIPDGVTILGDAVFSGCTSLKKIVLPAGLEELPNSSFEGCSSLENVVFASNTKEIGANAFENCTSLKSLDLPSGLKEISGSAFDGCKSLTSVKIPDSVSVIGGNAFNDCESLKTVVLPSGLKEISGYTFRNCTSLVNLKIPQGVKTIGECAFQNCSSLQSVSIPSGVDSIYSGAFSNCRNLGFVEVPLSVSYFGSDVFAGMADISFIVCYDDWQADEIYYYCLGAKSKTLTCIMDSPAGGWIKDDGNWYYLSSKGPATGWKTIDGDKYYFGTSSKKMLTGLQKISGKRYHFGTDGVMKKNSWQKSGSAWYYFDSTGAAKSGWMTLGGKKYYLSTSSNKMLTGLNKISGKRYYFDSSGVMAKNAWKKVGSYWYYLGSTGQAKSGWMKSGGSWYYFDPATNRMATGTKTIDGKRYRFSSSGVML